MDDEPMWVADRVVAPTPGSAITIPETANKFAIKDRDTENEVVRLMMFPLSLTGEAKTWLDELNEGTIKTWDELRTAFISRFFSPALFDRDLNASINLMPYSLYAKVSLETLKPTKIRVRLADRSFQYPVGIAENMLVEVGKFTFCADFVILEMEEDILTSSAKSEKLDFDALLDEGSEILHSIEGTILEEKLFAKFDEFIAMTVDENYESKSDTEEPPFEKITFNTDYKIKTSIEEPHTDLELKPLPDNLEYVFLEEPSFLPVSYHLSSLKKKKINLYPFLKDTNKPLLGNNKHSWNLSIFL
ncbi:reverse transcriptase domain-containing protein [Tanacetum coccineum]